MADFERLIVHQHQAREDFTADNKILLKKMQAQIDALTTAGTLQQEMINIQQLKEDQAGQIRKASLALLQAGQISPLNFSEREERWHSIRQATTELRSTLANLHAQKIQLQITVANNAVTQRVGLLPMNAEIVRLEQSRNNYQREIRQELIAPLAGRYRNTTARTRRTCLTRHADSHPRAPNTVYPPGQAHDSEPRYRVYTPRASSQLTVRRLSTSTIR